METMAIDAENPYAPPASDVGAPLEGERADLVAFQVMTPLKLVVMAVVTFNLYVLYWHYRQWKIYKRHEQADIWPVPRALFFPFTGFDLYARIARSAERHQVSMGWKDWQLGLAGLLINVLLWGINWLGSRGGIFSLAEFLVFLPPLAAQVTINHIHLELDPERPVKTHFSGWDWVVIAVCAVLWILAAIGTLIPRSAY